VVLAAEELEVDQSQVTSAEQNVEAARQALNAVAEMQGYLRVTRAVAAPACRHERNVHRARSLDRTAAKALQLLSCELWTTRLRLVVPVPEAYALQRHFWRT
jgi:hypothetical protein